MSVVTATLVLVITLVGTETFRGFYHAWKTVYGTLDLLHESSRQLETLRMVVDECSHTLDAFHEAPRHVRESLIATFDAGTELAVTMDTIMPRAYSSYSSEGSFSMRLQGLMACILYAPKITVLLSEFRQQVYLLRDMCSDVKTDALNALIVETSNTILKLTLLAHKNNASNVEAFSDLKERVSAWAQARNEKQASPSDNAEESLSQQIVALSSDNYTKTAVVLVENHSQHGGERFIHKPARVKVDTGSDVDIVSLQYLLDIGYRREDLIRIPVENQTPVTGINNITFTPKFEIGLQWFRQGEMQVNRGSFFVAEEASFDIILKSTRLVEELGLSSLLMYRPRKRREVIKRELEEEKKRIDEEKKLEEEELHQEIRRRNMVTGRASTLKTTTGDENV